MIDWTNKQEVLIGLDRWPDIFADGFRSILSALGELAASKAAELAPVGAGSSPTGHLSNSIQSGEPYPYRTGWAVDFGTPAVYGAVIEYGRRPGSRMPPIQAIADWVWQTRHRFPEVQDEDDARRIAYPIAKAIAKKGFANAPDGPGKGWGMRRRGGEYAISKSDIIIEQGKAWISRKCEEAVNG